MLCMIDSLDQFPCEQRGLLCILVGSLRRHDRLLVSGDRPRSVFHRDCGSWAGSDGSGHVGFFFGWDLVDEDVGEVVVSDFEDYLGGFHALGVALAEACVDLDLHLGLPILWLLWIGSAQSTETWLAKAGHHLLGEQLDAAASELARSSGRHRRGDDVIGGNPVECVFDGCGHLVGRAGDEAGA